jgi:hypothetical protein
MLGVSMTQSFIVYELWNPLKQTPFYVGKTSNCADRLGAHLYEANSGKISHKANTIRMILREGLSVDFKVVYDTDDEDDALDKEIELISFYGRADIGTGFLTNGTDGGDGTSGRLHKDETKRKLSSIRKSMFKAGKLLPMRHSEEHKHRLRMDNKGGKATARSIYRICADTGRVLETYMSTQQAATLIKGSKGNIHAVATRWKNRLAYGFYWRLVDDEDVCDGRLLTFPALKEIQGRTTNIYVHQYDIDGRYIKTWNSQKEVCAQYNLPAPTLSSAISRSTRCRGFYWTKTKHKTPDHFRLEE